MTENREQHTPGPWVATADYVTLPSGGAPLASGIPFDQRLANARLIAAAPDLLDVARSLAYWAEIWAAAMPDGSMHQSGVRGLAGLAHAAIAKATGSETASSTPAGQRAAEQ